MIVAMHGRLVTRMDRGTRRRAFTLSELMLAIAGISIIFALFSWLGLLALPAIGIGCGLLAPVIGVAATVRGPRPTAWQWAVTIAFSVGAVWGSIWIILQSAGT